MRLKRLQILIIKASSQFRNVIMIAFSDNIIAIISATGILLSLLLLSLGIRLKYPDLIMT